MITDAVTGQVVPFSFNLSEPAEKVAFGRIKAQWVPDEGESGEDSSTYERGTSVAGGLLIGAIGIPKVLKGIARKSYSVNVQSEIDAINKYYEYKEEADKLNRFNINDLSDPSKRDDALKLIRAKARYEAQAAGYLNKAKFLEKTRVQPFSTGWDPSEGFNVTANRAFELSRRIESFDAAGDFLSPIFRIFARALGASNILSYYSNTKSKTVFNLNSSQVGFETRDAWKRFLSSSIFDSSLTGTREEFNKRLSLSNYLVFEDNKIFQGVESLDENGKKIIRAKGPALLSNVNLVTGTGREKVGILTEIDAAFGDRIGPARKIRGELVGGVDGFFFLPQNIKGPFTSVSANQSLFLIRGWMSASVQRTAGLMEELALEGKNLLKDTIGYLSTNKNTGKVTPVARALGILPDFHLKSTPGMLATYMGHAMKAYAGLAIANQSQFWQQNNGLAGWIAGGATNTAIGTYLGHKIAGALKLNRKRGGAIGAIIGASSFVPGSPFNDGVIGGAAKIFGNLNRIRSSIGEVTLMNTWRRTLDKIAPGSTDFTSAMFFGLGGALALTYGYRKFSGKTFVSQSDRIDYFKGFDFTRVEDLLTIGGSDKASITKDKVRFAVFDNIDSDKKAKIYNELKTYIEDTRKDPAKWTRLQNQFSMVEDTYSARSIALAEILGGETYEKARAKLQNPNLSIAKRIETMALELPLTRAVAYGAIALTAMYAIGTGQLGTLDTPNEIGQYNRGEKQEVVKRAQNWEGGSEAWEGAEPLFHRPTLIARLIKGTMSRGSSNRGMIEEFLLKNFTYELERESYYDKPAPITSAAFDGLPMMYLAIKPLADLIKRPKLMHEEMWHQNGQYLEISSGLDPLPDMSLGGLGIPAPESPYSYSRMVSKAINQVQAFAGIRGFYSKELTKIVGGFTGLADQRKELESYTENVDMTSRFYDLHSGGGFLGVPFVSEVIRRFLVKNNTDTYNPIANELPSWLPEAMRYGNPYTSMKHGGSDYRLPGEGYASLNPEMRGVDPENYTSIHRFKILGNIAPWSNEYRNTKDQVESEISRGIISKAGYQDYYQTVQEIRERQKKLAFNPYLYDPTNYESIIGKVKNIDSENLAFELEGITGKFTLAGVTNNAGDLVGQLNLEIQDAAKQRRKNADQFERLIEKGEILRVTVPRSIGHAVNERGHIMAAVTNPLTQGSYNSTLAGNANLAKEDSVVGQYAMGGLAGKTLGRAYQALTHTATSLTAPIEFISKFGFSPGMKLMPERNAREEYEQFNLYGSRIRLWQNPLSHWFGSAAKSFAHNVVGLDFVTPGINNQRNVEEYFDKAKYIKYKNAEQAALEAGNEDMAVRYKSIAKDTLIGGSGYVGNTRFRNLMKGNESAYALGMAAEINPNEQNRILSVLPDFKRRIMAGKYGQQDQAAINRMLMASPVSETGMQYLGKLNEEQRADGYSSEENAVNSYNWNKKENEEYSEYRRRKELENYFGRNNQPKADWSGFNPAVDLEDVKLRYLQNEGLDFHNYSIFESRVEHINRKPYITQHDINQVGIGYANLNMAINALHGVRQLMNAPISGTTFIGNSESRSSNFIELTLQQDRFYRFEGM